MGMNNYTCDQAHAIEQGVFTGEGSGWGGVFLELFNCVIIILERRNTFQIQSVAIKQIQH